MLTKKCHKLENTLNEENEKNDDDDNNELKEILIVDANNNLEESEEEKEGDEQIEKSINDSKYRLSKPKPILNVDTNSINITDYQINDNNYSYNIYPNSKYNFYTGRGTSYYIPKSYSFYGNSINNLASNKDYSYNNRSNNIPYKLNRNNSYIGYSVSKNNNNNNYPYADNTDNHSLTYSFYLQQKPSNVRSSSYIKSQNNYNIDENRYNLKNSNSNDYLSIIQRMKANKYNIDTQNNYYPTKERVTYVLNNYRNNIGTNISNKNNTFRGSNKSIPYNLNYNYLLNN